MSRDAAVLLYVTFSICCLTWWEERHGKCVITAALIIRIGIVKLVLKMNGLIVLPLPANVRLWRSLRKVRESKKLH